VPTSSPTASPTLVPAGDIIIEADPNQLDGAPSDQE
jgi:hypothetical protein